MDDATLICVGPSHRTASLAARERFALVGDGARLLHLDLAAHPLVAELVSLSTCNRSELYLVVRQPDRSLPAVIEAFARFARADPREIATMLAVRHDLSAVRHLMRVASGLDSVVVGEAQIQGQLKLALEAARTAGTCGPLLDRAFTAALAAGKRARSETGIGSGLASVGSVAAELVAQHLGGSLDERSVVVIGAGKMGSLAARSLAARGAQRIDIANRGLERAQQLARACGGGDGVSLSDLDDELATCDAVVASTDAPHPVIDRARVERAMHRRGGRALVLVDLAVPRDIDEACRAVPGVHLFDLDDLERVVGETRSTRAGEVAAAELVVEEEAALFASWRRQRGAAPAIRVLRDTAEQIRSEELRRAQGRFAHLAPVDQARIEQLTRAITQRMLHEPTMHLREAAEHA